MQQALQCCQRSARRPRSQLRLQHSLCWPAQELRKVLLWAGQRALRQRLGRLRLRRQTWQRQMWELHHCWKPELCSGRRRAPFQTAMQLKQALLRPAVQDLQTIQILSHHVTIEHVTSLRECISSRARDPVYPIHCDILNHARPHAAAVVCMRDDTGSRKEHFERWPGLTCCQGICRLRCR